ncbi:queuosine precursor transporter [Methylicorpusculum sp.]|uniref:queuosine precursor transporter n=1 Tax=Methylicorpusculum sp. TaxID=2713644 RepID=UPI002ABC3585|nr:queuosine precursor transporter [Methylicorpusculum sp.]MDZ4149982.1 queuosine precursor transporter [Methylicorpusculum sp.]
MNELIFLLQIATICLGLLGAYKLGSQALVSFVCLCAVLANLFVLEQISLFGLSVTAADAFAVGAMIALNMLQEKKGAVSAQKALVISFWGLIFYALVTQLHLAYLPSIYDTTAPAYQALLQFMPRLTLASLAAYFLSQKLNIFLYTIMRTQMHRFLVLRTYATLLISQLADTILFAFLGLSGLVPNIWTIILFSYSVKMITIALAAPCVALAKRL